MQDEPIKSAPQDTVKSGGEKAKNVGWRNATPTPTPSPTEGEGKKDLKMMLAMKERNTMLEKMLYALREARKKKRGG